jgi:hypothetical protein
MMKTRSPLSDEEKERAKVLNASGKSPNYIAKGMGRSHHTLQKFLDKPDVREQVSIQREELAGMFDNITYRIVKSVTEKDIAKASLQQKLVSAGIATDKASLLRNELPQTINVAAFLDLIELIRDEHKRRDGLVTIEVPALPLPAESQ